MASLGNIRAAQGRSDARGGSDARRGSDRRQEALRLFEGALRLEVDKDAFHMSTVWELLNKLRELNVDEARQREARLLEVGQTPLFPICRTPFLCHMSDM